MDCLCCLYICLSLSVGKRFTGITFAFTGGRNDVIIRYRGTVSLCLKREQGKGERTPCLTSCGLHTYMDTLTFKSTCAKQSGTKQQAPFMPTESCYVNILLICNSVPHPKELSFWSKLNRYYGHPMWVKTKRQNWGSNIFHVSAPFTHEADIVKSPVASLRLLFFM